MLIDEADGAVREAKPSELEPETYRVFYAAVGNAVESGRPDDVPVKAAEGRDMLRILEAVVESATSGRDVVLAQPEAGETR